MGTEVQYVAQILYTSVCNRYIFSSVKRKFLKFLSEIAHLLTFNMYSTKIGCLIDVSSKTPMLPSFRTPDPVSIDRTKP